MEIGNVVLAIVFQLIFIWSDKYTIKLNTQKNIFSVIKSFNY